MKLKVLNKKIFTQRKKRQKGGIEEQNRGIEEQKRHKT